MLVKNNYFSEKKIIQLTGFFLFIVLTVLSQVYFRERILQNDNSFYFFKLVQFGKFQIEHNRYGSVITQLLPLASLKADLSLETAIRLYSFNFILVIYLYFLISTKVFNDPVTGFAILLSSVFAFRYVFFLPVSEFYQGCLLILLFWSYLQQKISVDKPTIKWIVMVILFIAGIFTFHPSNIIPLAFIVGLYFVRTKKLNLKFFILIFGVAIMSWLRLKMMFADGYETGRMPSIGDMIHRIPHIFSRTAFRIVSSNLIHDAAFLLSILFIFIASLKKKIFLLSGYSLAASAVFICFLFVALPDMESPYLFDNYLPALGVFITLPLFILLQKFKFRYSVFTIIILFGFSVVYICNSGVLQQNRIKYISNLCKYGEAYPEKRYIIDIINYPWTYAWTTFSLPYETMLYQASEHPGSPLTFSVIPDVSAFDSVLAQNPSFFLGPEWDYYWMNQSYFVLNPKYFKLPALGYKKVSTHQDIVGFDESKFDTSNFKIRTEFSVIKSHLDSFVIVPVKIINTSGLIMPSIGRSQITVRISYHIYNNNGEIITWDGLRTPFLVDIDKEFSQGVKILLPEKKGKYKVGIDIVTEDKRWWGQNCSVTLIN